MIVRQSDAHAWAEALIDGRWQRVDPTAAVAPSRIEMGLGGALPAGEPVPLPRAARRRPGSSSCGSPGTRSTTTGAATSSASTTSGSARCCASWKLDACRAGRSPAAPMPLVAGLAGRAAGLAGLASPPRDRAQAMWEGALPPARARRPPAASRTKARSTTPTAPRAAGPSSPSPSGSSASRTRSCATAPMAERPRIAGSEAAENALRRALQVLPRAGQLPRS